MSKKLFCKRCTRIDAVLDGIQEALGVVPAILFVAFLVVSVYLFLDWLSTPTPIKPYFLNVTLTGYRDDKVTGRSTACMELKLWDSLSLRMKEQGPLVIMNPSPFEEYDLGKNMDLTRVSIERAKSCD